MKRFMSFLTLIALTLSLTTLVNCSSTSKHEGTGEYVDDSVITTKVKAKLLDEPKLKSTQISVKTYKGVVQLSGFVHSQDDITKAVDIARATDGVKSVENDMHLR